MAAFVLDLGDIPPFKGLGAADVHGVADLPPDSAADFPDFPPEPSPAPSKSSGKKPKGRK